MAGPEHVDPEVVRRLVQLCAHDVLRDLRHLYPLADPHQLETIAVGTATDQVGQLGPMFHALADGRVEKVGLALIRPSKLAGGKTEELRFGAPRDLDKCATLAEVLSAATIYAMVYCPSVRAILAKHGYRLAFMADGKHLARAQKVVSLEQARARRERDEDEDEDANTDD